MSAHEQLAPEQTTGKVGETMGILHRPPPGLLSSDHSQGLNTRKHLAQRDAADHGGTQRCREQQPGRKRSRCSAWPRTPLPQPICCADPQPQDLAQCRLLELPKASCPLRKGQYKPEVCNARELPHLPGCAAASAEEGGSTHSLAQAAISKPQDGQ